jgi:hypothetical protein
MVRALWDGRKTQTRRIAKVVKDINIGCEIAPSELAAEVNAGNYENVKYAPGDRLWVRETWAVPHDYDQQSPSTVPVGARARFFADGNTDGIMWRPSIFMPRWASRLTLTVTAVRMQRLCDISEADAKAEGAMFHDGGSTGHSGWRHDFKDVHDTARSSFAALWDDINGDDKAKRFNANPWIIAITFDVAKTNIDALKVAA